MEQFSLRTVAARQHEFFSTGASKDLAFRREQLRRLRRALTDGHDQVLRVLGHDLGKPAVEAYGGEVAVLLHEIDLAIRKLAAWARPRRVPTPLALFPGVSRIAPEPYGSALIIGPWNYPFQLALGPLIGAMAAGNCAVVKPSELAPHSSALMAELLAAHFDPAYIAVCEGGIEETRQLLAQPFDYIFFTGGTRVGKVIMAAAAQHLTPLTLELGGKNPCIVAPDANLAVAARRIMWGKCFNAGQTCVAPDYVVAHRTIKAELLERMTAMIPRFYGSNPLASPDYARIVNDAHVRRLSGLLREGEIVTGGQVEVGERYIAPTILDQVTWEHAVMQEEIFGPILPVLTYDDLEALLAVLRPHPKPLALYVFAHHRPTQRRILQAISSGGVCINDTVDHILNARLPFGGVGASGLGAYHGKASFETFSHQRSILTRGVWLDPPLKYPPYRLPLRYFAKLLKYLA
jgi:aldehyde dehydrogenase (NAD+)